MAAPLLMPQGPRGAVAPLQVVERVVEAGGRPPCVHMATCGVWLLEDVGRGQVSRVEVEVSRPVASRAFGAHGVLFLHAPWQGASWRGVGYNPARSWDG